MSPFYGIQNRPFLSSFKPTFRSKTEQSGATAMQHSLAVARIPPRNASHCRLSGAAACCSLRANETQQALSVNGEIKQLQHPLQSSKAVFAFSAGVISRLRCFPPLLISNAPAFARFVQKLQMSA
jgi:hypothetical protein